MKLIGRIICALTKHKRGRFVRSIDNGTLRPLTKVYACPRCGRESVYRVKAKP